jgi:ABC-type lipoprotein export system ATPase subunit
MQFVIESKGISKVFNSGENKIEVLSGVDLELIPGDSISIQGSSGSGKSTFLNILGLLETPDQGSVKWLGKDVSSMNSNEIAKQRSSVIGFVYQHYYLIPELNVLENVLIPAKINGTEDASVKDRALHLLKVVGLEDRKKQVTNQLSGGERQRVALARALINQPKLILADEPTGNLDEETGLVVMDMLLNLCEVENAALILVTHNQEFAKRTNQAMRLTLGKINPC